MRSSRRLNLRQRIVIVVGLGLGLAFLGTWITAPRPLTGWTGYAPLSSSTAYSSRLSITFAGGPHPWVRLLIWLALTVFWSIASIVLFRSSAEP
jgi:heme/copper-type cytochrome/quinol oxidase subunit 1